MDIFSLLSVSSSWRNSRSCKLINSEIIFFTINNELESKVYFKKERVLQSQELSCLFLLPKTHTITPLSARRLLLPSVRCCVKQYKKRELKPSLQPQEAVVTKCLISPPERFLSPQKYQHLVQTELWVASDTTAAISLHQPITWIYISPFNAKTYPSSTNKTVLLQTGLF